jgi:DedD protein
MDRALKERVIGAVVLVTIAVLVVPVFLDGPSDDAQIISEPVSLPGQNEQERKTQTIVLNRDRSEPVPTPAIAPSAEKSKDGQPNNNNVAAKKTTSVAESAAKPAKDDTIEPASKPAPTSTTGMWAVQLGSFSSQGNAEKLAAKLRSQGYAAFLSQLQTGTGQLHRVRIGPQKDRDSAKSVAARLDSAGHNGQVVPHP